MLSSLPDVRAFLEQEDLLLRYTGDQDEWVLAVGRDLGSAPESTMRVGHFGFDHPDVQDHITSRHAEHGGFARSAWWAPVNAWRFRGGAVERLVGDAAPPHLRQLPMEVGPSDASRGVWRSSVAKDDYLSNVERLMGHIQRGDIYEVNYCTERTAYLPAFDAAEAFERLIRNTQAPFAAFYKQGDQLALCMSPERFLRLEGDHVITQPMKGTRRRVADPEVDAGLRAELEHDAKERSENIMAVDVARNDLSRVAIEGSVAVPELCAVKTYARVHQMVSTVEARLPPDRSLNDLISATFPMASMTGAPKRRALQLIDQVESSRRGLYSGSIGYLLPDGTLDLNVVIRTITYDISTGMASLFTGSAITAQSDPEKEWEECEVKAESVLKGL